MVDSIPPEVVEAAKVAGYAGAGAFIYHTIRPAATFAKAATNGVSSVMCGLIFTHPVMDWTGLPESYSGGVGAVLGMCGLGIASALIKAVDQLDLSGFLPKRKGKS
jgi:hypothetical protein